MVRAGGDVTRRGHTRAFLGAGGAPPGVMLLPLWLLVLLPLWGKLPEVLPVVAEVIMVVAPTSTSTSTPPLETPPGEEAPSSAPEVEGPLEATVVVPPDLMRPPRAPGLVDLGVLPLAGFGGGGSGPGARPGPGAVAMLPRPRVTPGA